MKTKAQQLGELTEWFNGKNKKLYGKKANLEQQILLLDIEIYHISSQYSEKIRKLMAGINL